MNSLMNRQRFSLCLQSIRILSPHVKHFSFKPLNGQALSFIPGQFITLHIPLDDKMLRRSYSLANSPGDTTLELAASYVPKGIASDFLFNMQSGDTVEATGPFGRLILRDEQPQRYLLVATGTGVTPYRAMLPELAQRMKTQTSLEVVLLLGVRTPEEALYQTEFAAFAQQHSRFKFYICYSRPVHPPTLSNGFSEENDVSEQAIPPQKGFHEHQGYVSALLKMIPLRPASDIAYLCGNPNMVDEVFALLTAQGFTTDKIRREKYISSK